MRDFSKYQGVIPAFYACYDDNGEISPERVRALTRYFIGKGVQGLYVGGSSGECIYQSVEERKVVLENVMAEARGKLTIIAHVACNDTKDSQTLAAHAQEQGVDAIASIPPIYFKLPDHAIAKYWNDISAAAPETDFVIYNIPQLAGVALTLPLLREMKKNPRVIGVKNSSMPVQDIQMFRDEGAGDLIGGTYGAMPELFLKARELFLAGKLEEAREIQNEVCRVIYRLCSTRGNMYAAIKAVLKQREGVEVGGVRAPLANLVPEDQEIVSACAAQIDQAIKKYC